jgi:hypothetical protein
VPRIGQQRQRIRQDPPDHLGHEDDRGDPERDLQPPPLIRATVAVSVVVVMVVVTV